METKLVVCAINEIQRKKAKLKDSHRQKQKQTVQELCAMVCKLLLDIFPVFFGLFVDLKANS